MAAPVVDFSLFGTAGTESYHARKNNFLANLNTALSNLWTEAFQNAGKSFSSRTGAVNLGQDNLPPLLGMILTIESGGIALRGPGQSADDPLFSTYPQWGVFLRINSSTAIRDAGTLTTQNIGGTGDAITAELSASMVAAGVTGLGGASEIEFIPVLPNTNPDPTFTIAGLTYTVRNADGGPWPANMFVPGRSYRLRRRNLILRVVAGDVTYSDLNAERLARIRGVAQSGFVTLTNVAGTGDVITAEMPAGFADDGISAANLRGAQFVAVATNTGPVTLNIDGQGAVGVFTSQNANLPAGYIQPGRFYTLTKLANRWRITAGDVVKGDLDALSAATASAGRTASILSLTNVVRTGDTYTADLAADARGQTLTTGSKIKFMPAAANAGAVTLTIGGVTYQILTQDGAVLPTNTLGANTPVIAEVVTGATMRLIGVTQLQHNALTARVAAVEPVLRTVINTDGTPARTLTLYTSPGFDITLNPNGEGGVIAGVPPGGGNGVPVNTRVTTRRRGNAVVMTWYDPTGRVYERVYVGGTWGAWAETTRWNNAQYQTINLSGQGLAARDLNLCITPGITWTGDGSSLVYNCPLEIDDLGGAVDGTARFNGTLQAIPMGAKIAQYYWDARKGQDSPFIRWYDVAGGTFTRWRYLLRPEVVGPTLVDFGDSIQAGVVAGAANSVPAQAAALVNGTLTNLGVSGRMMCGTTAGDFIPQIDAPANAAAIAAAEIITVAYGTNDWNGAVPIGAETDTVNGTFYGAMAEGLAKIRALNATAKIAFAVPIYRGKAYSNPRDWTEAGAHSGSGLLVEDYRQAIRRFSAINGLPVLEMSHNFAINAVSAPTYLPDCLHPNIAGAALMAEWRVAQWVAWKWAGTVS